MDCHQNETVETTLTIQKRIFNELKKNLRFRLFKKRKKCDINEKT